METLHLRLARPRSIPISTEMGKEAAPDISIFPHCIGPQGETKRLDMRFENLFEAGPGRVHEI
jgi:hypothetical protein